MSAADTAWTTNTTWLVCDATSESDSEAATVTVTTGNVDSATFTPGAITVDGVALKLRSRPGTTGTFTVTLRNSTDGTNTASVTVNVSDFPATVFQSNGSTIVCGGWMFFNFGATALTAGKAYLIRVTASSNSQLTLYGSTTTNTSRQLRTTTAPGAAPAAGDKLIVCGEWTAAATVTSRTVTMDNTASTVYGTEAMPQSLTIATNGTLTCGTTASTAYLLLVAGIILVGRGGTLNIGTAGGAMPSTSSCRLFENVTTNAASGLLVHGGTLSMVGATKTLKTTVTSLCAAAQAVINVADVTGWANTDDIAATPTRRVTTQGEARVIQSIATLAVTATANWTYNHDGSGTALAPNNPRGHVANLTNNIKLRGTDNTHRAYLYIAGGSTVYMRFVELKWVGQASVYPKNGLVIDPLVTSVDIQYCSLWSYQAAGGTGTATWDNVTFSNCVFWNVDGGSTSLLFPSATSGSSWAISNNLSIGPSSATNGFRIDAFTGTISGNIAAGHGADGFVSTSTTGPATEMTRTPGTFSGNEFYCNASGIEITGTVPVDMIFASCTLWRNTSYGLYLNRNTMRLLVQSSECFGNTTANITINGSDITRDLRLLSCTLNGETSFATANGVLISTSAMNIHGYIETCSMGATVAHTTADIGFANGFFDLYVINCVLASGTEITAFSGPTSFLIPFIGSQIHVQKWDQGAGDHRTITTTGILKTDSTAAPTALYRTAAPSQRLTPSAAAYKLNSTSKVCGAASGQTITASVWVRKSELADAAAYAGNQPRLIVKRNAAVGAAADVVLDTMTAAVGTWEQLTGTTAALSGDAGALEFYVDCDGTGGGFVNVDDWSFTVA